jgi:hypothetical protein
MFSARIASECGPVPPPEIMGTHRSLTAVAAVGFIATGCSLDPNGLGPSMVRVGPADGGADDPDSARGSPPEEASAGQDATPAVGDATVDTAPVEDAPFEDVPVQDARVHYVPLDSGHDTGSPNTFSLGTPTPTDQFGAGPGTSAYNVACPANEVIIGFKGVVSNTGYWIDIASECGTLSIEPGTLDVSVVPGTVLPVEGPPLPTTGGTTQEQGNCAANEVVVGFIAEDTTNGHIHQLTIDCAKLTIEDTGSYTAEWSSSSVTTVAVGGAPPATPGENMSPDIRCNGDPAAVASQTNDAFDDLGLVLFGVDCSVITPQ